MKTHHQLREDLELPQQVHDAYAKFQAAEKHLYEPHDPGMLSAASKGQKAAATRHWNHLVKTINKHDLPLNPTLARLTK